MWIVCITSVRHVLTVNGYGGRQTKENEKSWCFKGWETLVIKLPRIPSAVQGDSIDVTSLSIVIYISNQRSYRLNYQVDAHPLDKHYRG